ncbi:MAG: thiamine phosphate synthase [Ruminococcaceae bacterium]|nr:thiamine phosphate synthase [Oscillospiraceae bacterium]
MKCDKKIMQLYAVTDRSWLGKRTLEEQVEDALKGGVTCVQLREKDLPEVEFLEEAKKIKALCNAYGVPFFINDNVSVAIACGADGVHVGQSDMEAGDVRKLIGADKILGVSAQTVGQAKLAEARGADYLGVGAVFSTSTKLDACDVSYETLKQITEAVSIPVVAIGGICEENIMQLSGSGIDGVAVVSAIFASEDICAATGRLLTLSEKMTKQ